jgi:serine/threonine-protein kinase RsbW
MTLIGQAEPLRGQPMTTVQIPSGSDTSAASHQEQPAAEPLPVRPRVGAIERVLDASFPGLPESVRDARRQLSGVVAGIPLADDVLLCLSEIATNAVLYTRSGRPGGEFTVTVDVLAGVLLALAVADQGGPWAGREADTYSHGLEIVHELALLIWVEGDADGRIVHVIFPLLREEES